MQILKYIGTSKIIWAFVLIAAMFVLLAPVGVVEAGATSKEEACDALGAGRSCSTVGTGLQPTIENVINLLSVLVGIVAVIMLIVGGLKYVTSGGDANATKSARDTILYALVGLVIVAIAQAIVQFVLQAATQ